MTITELARPEIRALRRYETSASPDGALRLHANEAPRAIGNGAAQDLNRYPAPRPKALTARLADYYGVPAENVLVTRGSSEGIDLLVRTFCRAGQDKVLQTPPVFGLYAVYASVQGAGVIDVPLLEDRDFTLDTPALLTACDDRTKLIFLCSPNNPVGQLVPVEAILEVAAARAAKSIVVVDEAYIEFSGTDSLAPLVSRYDNLVVLRTLSKALALAGARCGAVIAPDPLIKLLDGVLAPYAVSSPVIRSAELALSDAGLSDARDAVKAIIAERERLLAELSPLRAVQKIWPSHANFLLVRFGDLRRVVRRLDSAGIAIRSFAGDAALENCARITVSSEKDNDRLIQAIRSID